LAFRFKNPCFISPRVMTLTPDHYESWQFSSINIIDPKQPALSFNALVNELVRGLDSEIGLTSHPWPFDALKDCQLSAMLCCQRFSYSFTAYHNALFLESEVESYYLYVCNTVRPPPPLISLALLSCGSDQLVLSLPFANDKS
jgi:hypothetical protein